MWERYLDRVLAGITDPAARRAAAQEMAAHLDDLVDEGLAEGLDRERAVRRALARFGRSASLRRAWAASYDRSPQWPVAAWAAGLALAALPIWSGLGIGAPGARWGPPAWLIAWAVVFGALKWRNFRAVMRRRGIRRPLAPPQWWRAWPFGVYGAAVGAAALRMWPWFHRGGPLWMPFAVALLGFILCRRVVGAGPLTHPVGSALAALGSWTAMALGWTIRPEWIAAPWGEPVAPLPLSIILAALLFTADGALALFSGGPFGVGAGTAEGEPPCPPDPVREDF